MTSVLSSLRYLFADILGEDYDAPPFVPEDLPEAAVPVVSEAIDRLVAYQGAGYAQLYVDRVRRFIGRPRVGVAMLCDIAQLLARRMAYEDPMRIAQLKLAALRDGAPPRSDAGLGKVRLDELVSALPEAAADPLLTFFGWIGCPHQRVTVRFPASLPWACLKLVAGLRRWRLFSIRYAEERAWVERWLHMIARCLDKQPASAAAVVATATMVQGYGDSYRQGLADWHAIIDGLAKPTFDGVLPLADLAAAIAEARAAAMPDPRQVALKRTIAQIRARALDGRQGSNAAE